MVDDETDYTQKIQNLLAQLREGSEYLENQREALTRVWNDFRGMVCTFYETQLTKSVKKVGVPESIQSFGKNSRAYCDRLTEQ